MLEPKDLDVLGYYDRDFTPFYAAQSDPRFCYCLFVPWAYEPRGTRAYELLVLVHGTERGAWDYRERFAEFAERNDCIILAPLFPCNTFGRDDLENYKYIECNGVRYDHVLLSMVDEVRARYRLRDERFLMFGFSGGGHFSHRFFYLHPQRLKAVAIGAPGIVTLLDERYDFWVGVRDLAARFGTHLDLEAMRRVRVQLVIGGNDSETWEIELDENDEIWRPGAEMTARLDRQGRMRLLRESFERHGLAVTHTVVPGVEHETAGVIPAVQEFFDEVLAGERALCGASAP